MLFQTSFQGPPKTEICDLSSRELFIVGSLFALLVIVGLYPNIVLQYVQGVKL